MIISHSKQVNFWKIPRTGSTTVEVILRLTAGLDYSQDVICTGHFFPDAWHNVPPTVQPSLGGREGYTRTHMTPQNAIDEGVLTLAQYNAYDNYCIVRDPVARLVSAHALGFSHDDWDVPAILNNKAKPYKDWALFKPQTEWLTLGGINVMPFSDYENSVRTILTAFGAPQPVDLPNITRRHPLWEQKMMQFADATPDDRNAIEAPDSPYHGDAQLNY